MSKRTASSWRPLRVVLLCGFVGFGAYSLHESLFIFKLTRIALALDRLAPHLGDAESPDEQVHALRMYPCTVVSLGCAVGLFLTRKSREPASPV